MPRRDRDTSLPSPFLRRLTVVGERLAGHTGYPFTLKWLCNPDFELTFEQPVTVIVGENGSGKSTLLEAVAALAGYDPAGGGKGYHAVSHANAREGSGADLALVLRGAWLPKVTKGWFFRAESFFSVARYLDEAAMGTGAPGPEFLSHSHGEGFLRFFAERTRQQGFYVLDEPESALSPRRQIELLRHLAGIQQDRRAQVIMATHAPLLMTIPGATLLMATPDGLTPTTLEQVPHFRLLRAFFADPEGFVNSALAGDEDLLF
ncbi:MAG: AAA family ATPase [Alphaproteobacteria bacterium]|nr:AAA family ATPase [Alphaproteobacteria bacterium]